MAEGNKVTRITGVKFVADVTIEGEYTIKQIVPFRDKLYLLIERPDSTPELYFVNEETQTTDKIKFEGLEPPNSKEQKDADDIIDSMSYRPEY